MNLTLETLWTMPRSVTPHALRVLGLATILVACASRDPQPTAMPSSSPPPPQQPNARHFIHKRSHLVIATGAANHRGRDTLVVLSQPQTIEAKFAYGPVDKDLHDEDVLIERELEDGRAEAIGTARTSADSDHDDGGRIHFTIPSDRALPLGEHTLRLTVVGDGTQTHLSLIVVPKDQPVFVSDVDGTLTASEVAEFPALARGKLPEAHPHAAKAFQLLRERGYIPIYLTARPEWLLGRTRAFLREHGFPPGIVCTKRDKSGGYGDSAATFKKMELDRIAHLGVRIEWAFGNMPSDARAYSEIIADPRHRVLYRQDDPTFGARRIESYEEILSELSAMKPKP